jgi:hypothetical protein
MILADLSGDIPGVPHHGWLGQAGPFKSDNFVSFCRRKKLCVSYTWHEDCPLKQLGWTLEHRSMGSIDSKRILYTVKVARAISTIQSMSWATGGRSHKLRPLYCTYLQRKEDLNYVFPEKKLRGLVTNFHFHASVSDLYIHRIGPPTVFCCSQIGRPIVGIYKWPTAQVYANVEMCKCQCSQK